MTDSTPIQDEGGTRGPAAVRALRATLGWLPIAFCLAFAAVMLVPAALGFDRYVITGGSMTGAIDRGSIVFAKAVPVSELRVGDVITYTPPAGSGPEGLVTHRIVWRGRDRQGAPSFRTKGDHNRAADPWRFTLRQPEQARAVFHIPYAGYVLAALGERRLRMLLIGLPALLIGVAVAVRLWREPEDAAPAAVTEATA